MTTSWLLLVIYAGCVLRLTRVITRDTLTEGIREWLRAKSHEDQVGTYLEHGTEHRTERVVEVKGLALWVWKWATCDWCASVWVGALCVVGWEYFASWFNLVAALFALSAVTGLISERS